MINDIKMGTERIWSSWAKSPIIRCPMKPTRIWKLQSVHVPGALGRLGALGQCGGCRTARSTWTARNVCTSNSRLKISWGMSNTSTTCYSQRRLLLLPALLLDCICTCCSCCPWRTRTSTSWSHAGPQKEKSEVVLGWPEQQLSFCWCHLLLFFLHLHDSGVYVSLSTFAARPYASRSKPRYNRERETRNLRLQDSLWVAALERITRIWSLYTLLSTCARLKGFEFQGGELGLTFPPAAYGLCEAKKRRVNSFNPFNHTVWPPSQNVTLLDRSPHPFLVTVDLLLMSPCTLFTFFDSYFRYQLRRLEFRLSCAKQKFAAKYAQMLAPTLSLVKTVICYVQDE